MDTYGTTSYGKFVFQKVDTLPFFTEYDIGRIVLTLDNGRYYFGGLTGWLGFLGNGVINDYQLNIGTGVHQINADSFPVRNLYNYFSEDDSIEDVLTYLATGSYLLDSSIETRHISNKSITPEKLAYGFNQNQIGSHNIPHYDSENKINSTIENQLNYILQTRPKILNKFVNITDYQYDMTNKLFVYSMFYDYVYNVFPIIQLYDSFGNQFLPIKITANKSSQRIKIYLTQRIELTISIVG